MNSIKTASRYLKTFIDKQTYYIPQNIIIEILKNFHITPLPNSSNHILGMYNYRGNVVPIFNSHIFADKNLNINSLENTILIIIKPKEEFIGLIFDKTTGLTDNIDNKTKQANDLDTIRNIFFKDNSLEKYISKNQNDNNKTSIVTVRLDKNCLMPEARCYVILKTLKDKKVKISKYYPNIENELDQKFDCFFVLIQTNINNNEIIKILNSVAEVDNVYTIEIPNKKNNFIKWKTDFNKEHNSKNKIILLDGTKIDTILTEAIQFVI